MRLLKQIIRGFKQVREDAANRRRFEFVRLEGEAGGLITSHKRYGMQSLPVTTFQLRGKTRAEPVQIVGYHMNFTEGTRLAVIFAKAVRGKNYYPVRVVSAAGFNTDFSTLKDMVLKETSTPMRGRLSVSDLDREMNAHT